MWQLAGAGCAGPGAEGESGAEGRPVKRLVCPPFITWTRTENSERELRNFLGPLYHQSQEQGGRKRSLNVLWPLFAHRLQVDRSGTGGFYYNRRTSILGGFFSLQSDNYDTGYLEAHFPWPLGHYFRGVKRSREDTRSMRSLRFLPIVAYEWSWRPLQPSQMGLLDLPAPGAEQKAESEVKADERVHCKLLSFVCGVEMTPRRRRLFLGGGVLVDEEGARTTFGILAHESGPSLDYEHQLLWRAILVKRWGSEQISSPSLARGRPSDFWRACQWLWRGPPRTLIRLGPILSYDSDWEADRKRFSILAGLFAIEREGPLRRGRILWFIPWRHRKTGT